MSQISKLEINLINLFQGNLPLYKSYWIYYVLGNFAISAPLLIITKVQIQNFIYTFFLIFGFKSYLLFYFLYWGLEKFPNV
jgi:hypothetical protein